jgi:hypothetical protein
VDVIIAEAHPAPPMLSEEQLVNKYKELTVPGYDGGRLQLRFHRRTGVALNMDETTEAAYKETLVQLWRWKAENNISQAAMAGLFKCFGPLLDPTVAAQMPKDYATMLTHLESLGFDISTEIEYDICLLCYFVYRGECVEDEECPKCKSPKQIDGCKNPNLGILKYRPIWAHLRKLFNCKGIAELMTYHATAAAKLGESIDSIVDVFDGIAWKKVMMGDPRCDFA